MTEPEKARYRWREYIEELYCGCDKPTYEELGLELEMNVDEDNKGPELIEMRL